MSIYIGITFHLAGEHMSDRVVELLKTFFHTGDTHKSERYTLKEMFEELKKNVETGE
jgi:hypothetical protein